MNEYGDQLGDPAEAPAAPAAPRRRFRRPVIAGVGTLAVAGAAVIGFTAFSGTASAYDVTDNHDGTLTVALHQLSGIDGANAKLQKLGVQAVVIPVRDGCTPIDSLADKDQHGKGAVVIGVRLGAEGPGSVTVDASGIPKGDTAVVAFQKTDHGFFGASVITDKPVPSCVSIPKPGDVPPGGAVASTAGGGSGAEVQSK